MKLKVMSYNEREVYHLCVDENGDSHRIDLFVNGDLPKGLDSLYLVGKTVEVDYTSPSIEIGYGVTIVED